MFSLIGAHQFDIMEDRKHLLQDLFDNQEYDKLIIPQVGNNTPLSVKVEVFLKSVLDLNEEHQFLSMTAMFSSAWLDHRLQWDPTKYGDIRELHLQRDQIWKPDLYIENAVGNHPPYVHTLDPVSMVLADADGYLLMASLVQLTTLCAVDTALFPFDTQKCEVVLSSWIYSDTYMSLSWNQFNLTTNLEHINPTWMVKNIRKDKVLTYETPSGIYYGLLLELTLSRRMSFIALAIIIPCLMLTLLTLVIFLLPASSGEKLGLGVAIWTSLVVFLLILVDLIPGSSMKMPLIGLYNLMILVLVTLSLLLSVVSEKIYAHNQPFPSWMKIIAFQFMAKLVLWKSKSKWSTCKGLDDETTISNGPSKQYANTYFPVSIVSSGQNAWLEWNAENEGSSNKNNIGVSNVEINQEICHIFDRFCLLVQLIILLLCTMFIIIYYQV